jgi:hypothetical protein
MTERLRGLLVTFEEDVREDDAEAIINAIRLIKRVLTVKTIPSNIDLRISEDRVRHELGQKLWKVIYPDRNES